MEKAYFGQTYVVPSALGVSKLWKPDKSQVSPDKCNVLDALASRAESIYTLELYQALSTSFSCEEFPEVPNMFGKDQPKTVSNRAIVRRLLNVREAAHYLGFEVDTIYKKSRVREVPCVKVGRALRFDVEALDRYIEQHTIETID